MIDTHCHLTFPELSGDVPGVLSECAAAGVTGVITISTTTRDCLEAARLAREYPNVWCTSGIHPLHSHEGPHEWENLRRVVTEATCVAWGELGLDNHYREPAREVQHAVLAEHLAFIERVRREDGIDKPIVIHCREAFDDLIPILKRAPFDAGRYVFHCFTGTAADARKVLDFGAMISLTGVATYKNARELREAVRGMPGERIMVETDAPYLSPEPHRGKWPCRPAWVRHTAESIAALRGEAFEDFHERVNENTRRFFGVEAER
ncbi:MAG: TatD family hydrolase [Phycisphaerales bacterium]